MKKSFHSLVLVFPFEPAWHYVNVPLDLVPKIKSLGWGSYPVLVTVGKTTWRTSIFPIKKDNYFIPLKKEIRVKENIFAGDEVKITFQLAKE